MGQLDNKVVLITGSSGMGAATARMAAAEGARGSLSLRSTPGECQSLAAEVGGGWHAGDLAQKKMRRAAVENCVARFGRIDGVFNVAGISGRRFGDGPLHECSAEGWDTLMNVESSIAIPCLARRLRHMLAAGSRGSIVNMGSVVALSPEPRHFATHAYAAGKGAIHALTTASRGLSMRRRASVSTRSHRD